MGDKRRSISAGEICWMSRWADGSMDEAPLSLPKRDAEGRGMADGGTSRWQPIRPDLFPFFLLSSGWNIMLFRVYNARNTAD